jgi:hypothetical protein
MDEVRGDGRMGGEEERRYNRSLSFLENRRKKGE